MTGWVWYQPAWLTSSIVYVPGPEVGERVGAVRGAGGRGHEVADRVEQVDRPALEARIARIEHAVAGEVVVDRAGEGHELEVAEDAVRSESEPLVAATV